jgi:hypothetical protein
LSLAASLQLVAAQQLLAQAQNPALLRQGARTDRESARRAEITSVLHQHNVRRPSVSAVAETVAMLRLENVYLSQGMMSARS